MKVKIDQFEGPLDLLLQLIENQELDITTVSLAKVTEQFLAYVRSLPAEASGEGGEKNPTHLADFLVIAAKLLVIKSKALLPNLDLGAEDEETAFDLTAQLLLYKKFKEAALFLKKLDSKRRQSWIRQFDIQNLVVFLPDPGLTAQTLGSHLKVLAEELKEIIRHPQDVIKEVVSISEKISHIQKLISEKLETSLAALIKDSKSKTEVIVTFLALLELIKQRVLTVEQNEMFGDVMIKKTG
ncbi:MAG: segregation/condensation protein A [Candidatus Doudnabacteria bacterium]|nr:segregation/condensation protein A [Candidatus Doudnabacteria bacterium]